jgi:hypothetical protein
LIWIVIEVPSVARTVGVKGASGTVAAYMWLTGLQSLHPIKLDARYLSMYVKPFVRLIEVIVWVYY